MTNKKRILFVNRSFWPDIEATGQLFTELCQALSCEYKITVIAGRSYYVDNQPFKGISLYNKESFENIEIIRVRSSVFWKGNLLGRLMNWLTYSILVFLASLKIKFDLMIIGTDPPLLGIIALIIKKMRSLPYIYNCRDIYPDVAVVMGQLSGKNILGRIFDECNRQALRSGTTICLGESMKQRILKKGIIEKDIYIIPDWVDTKALVPIEKKDNDLLKKFSLSNKFVIMHSGNIGLSQNFDSLLDAFSSLTQENVYLVFVGDGAGKKKLQEDVAGRKISRVVFLPYQPKSLLSHSLGMADLHIISLKKGLSGAIIPSKMYGIMAAGKPYLAIIDAESEPAFFAKKYGCGLWADPEDHASICEKLSWAIAHPIELKAMGGKSRYLAETVFEKDIVVRQWHTLLKEYFYA